MARRKHAKRGGCLSRLIAFSLLIMLIGYPFFEAWNLQVEEKTLVLDSMPSELNNLKIVYLSDIHMSWMYPMSRVETLVQKVNALNPDIILLGGDYAEDSEGAISFFQHAPMFHARLLVAGVLGNHDRTLPESNLSPLINAMRAAGVTPLINDVLTYPIGSAQLRIAGIDDINNGHPDIQSAASQVSADDFVIFLSHSPGGIPPALKATDRNGRTHWFDMALCGHTHGGQVTFLGQALIPEFQKVDGRYQTGWITEFRAPILTSNGVGTSHLPIRIFAPPQIHVITLKVR